MKVDSKIFKKKARINEYTYVLSFVLYSLRTFERTLSNFDRSFVFWHLNLISSFYNFLIRIIQFFLGNYLLRCKIDLGLLLQFKRKMKLLLQLTSMLVLVGSAASNSYSFTMSSSTACDASSKYAITPLSVSAGCSGSAACSVGDKLTVDSTCKK